MKKNVKVLVLFIVMAIVFVGCVQPPQIAEAHNLIYKLAKLDAGKYAPEEFMKIEHDMSRAMQEVVAQDRKFFKKFGQAKELLEQVIYDARTLEAKIPDKKYNYEKNNYRGNNDERKILEQAVSILRNGDTRIEELIADMIDGVVSYRFGGSEKK